MNKQERRQQGKRNKINGNIWEGKVRADLESKSWFVTKFQNNVEFFEGDNIKGSITGIDLPAKMIPCKRKFNPYNKVMTIGTGFPDFIIWRIQQIGDTKTNTVFISFDVCAVECKSNGYLDKIEKGKCKWYLDNKVFNQILIASKKKEGRKVIIEYKEFKSE